MSEVIDVETGEVVTIEESVAYAPTLALSPEAAKQMVVQVHDIQRNVMREGVDYMTIRGTNKPSLLKPGAETLQRVFGLGVEFTRTDYERADGVLFAAYKCRVTRTMPTGAVVTVAECEGCAGNDEQKWRKAPLNTIMKMAQKRAYVGAILLATGASDLFTQDVEDMEQAKPAAPVEEPFDASQSFDPAVFVFKKGKHAGETPATLSANQDGREYLRWLAYDWKIRSGGNAPEQRWAQAGIRAYYETLEPLEEPSGTERLATALDADEIEFPSPTTIGGKAE